MRHETRVSPPKKPKKNSLVNGRTQKTSATAVATPKTTVVPRASRKTNKQTNRSYGGGWWWYENAIQQLHHFTWHIHTWSEPAPRLDYNKVTSRRKPEAHYIKIVSFWKNKRESAQAQTKRRAPHTKQELFHIYRYIYKYQQKED